MESLINLLKRAIEGLEAGWLYLPESKDWEFSTPGQIINVDELKSSEVDENDEPLVAQEKGLISTLESTTIESIVSCANDLECELSDTLLLESFLYYYNYDAFLPYPGYKPRPPSEHQKKVDRDFYECLGLEQTDVQCKNKTCQRGAIKAGIYCKIHHFEMILMKPCPFAD